MNRHFQQVEADQKAKGAFGDGPGGFQPGAVPVYDQTIRTGYNPVRVYTDTLPAFVQSGNTLTGVAPAPWDLSDTDGIAIVPGDRILYNSDDVNGDPAAGIYDVVQLGSAAAGVPWILQRSFDADEDTDFVSGYIVAVEEGHLCRGLLWQWRPIGAQADFQLNVTPGLFNVIARPKFKARLLALVKTHCGPLAALTGTITGASGGCCTLPGTVTFSDYQAGNCRHQWLSNTFACSPLGGNFNFVIPSDGSNATDLYVVYDSVNYGPFTPTTTTNDPFSASYSVDLGNGCTFTLTVVQTDPTAPESSTILNDYTWERVIASEDSDACGTWAASDPPLTDADLGLARRLDGQMVWLEDAEGNPIDVIVEAELVFQEVGQCITGSSDCVVRFTGGDSSPRFELECVSGSGSGSGSGG